MEERWGLSGMRTGENRGEAEEKRKKEGNGERKKEIAAKKREEKGS